MISQINNLIIVQLLAVLYTGLLIFVIYNVLQLSQLKSGMKLFWVIIIILLPIIGMSLYGIFVKKHFKLD